MDSNFRFRASGDTPHRPRGEAASHRSRLPLRRDPPSGRDLDDGTVSQLLEELAGEMNRPSDRKRRISGYGDRTWRREASDGWSRSGFRVNHLSTPNSSSAWTACSACFEFEAASGGYTELLHLHGTSLREETLASGLVSAAEFDALVRPEAMLAPYD